MPEAQHLSLFLPAENLVPFALTSCRKIFFKELVLKCIKYFNNLWMQFDSVPNAKLHCLSRRSKHISKVSNTLMDAINEHASRDMESTA